MRLHSDGLRAKLRPAHSTHNNMGEEIVVQETVPSSGTVFQNVSLCWYLL